MPALPERVSIREVGPRDGFQNEPETIPTAEKIRLIDMLSATGLAADRGQRLRARRGDPPARRRRRGAGRGQAARRRRLLGPDPKRRGLERALALRDRFDEVSVFLSASETHNRRNVNRSVAESLAGLERDARRARARPGCAVRASSRPPSAAPMRARCAPERVFEIAERLAAAGCEEVAFGDTTGMANPRQVARVLRRGQRAPRRGRADRPLPQHPRPGSRQRARRAGGGHRLLRVELRRARRLSGAARLDRQHLHRGPRLDAARDGDRDRDRPGAPDRRLPRRAGASSAARSVSHLLRAGPIDWHRVRPR